MNDRSIECPAVVAAGPDGNLHLTPIRAACEGCDGGCALQFTRRTVAISRQSSLEAGQSVVLSLPVSALRRFAFIAFGVPMLAMVAMTALAAVSGWSDARAAQGAIAGLLIGLAAAKWLADHQRGAFVSITVLDSDIGIVNNGAPYRIRERSE